MKTRLKTLLRPRNEYRLVGLMLVLLHGSVWWDFGGAVSRSLMLAHLGLFLIWQPFWNREQRLTWRNSLVYFLGAACFVAWLNWWLVVFWVLLLTGLVGGRVLTTRRDRYTYMLTLVFLVSELLIGCIPPMFSIDLHAPNIRNLFSDGLLAIPALLLFIPAEESAGQRPHAVDFLYGLTVALLSGVLALGSLLSMYATHADYPVALFQTVLGLALFLLAISWLWMPLAGFSGFGPMWERYLLNIGTPFEHWLSGLAELADGRQTPVDFLRSAMELLVELPWVRGIWWRCAADEGRLGDTETYAFQVMVGEVLLVLYTTRPMGTALLLHARLLLQLVGHFYTAKLREQELAQRAHLQAIYETGARVTHDIKNLLQTLHTLSTALEHGGTRGEKGREESQALLRRQMPHLTQRLRLALDKLQAPERSDSLERLAEQWWNWCQARNAGSGIVFEAEMEPGVYIPAEFFDSALDNLIENARAKQLTDTGTHIKVNLVSHPERVCLRVCDTGEALDRGLVEHLFRAPVPSRTGLGIGLYQMARQAEKLGFHLRLERNEPHDVCFAIEGPPVRVEHPPSVTAGHRQ